MNSTPEIDGDDEFHIWDEPTRTLVTADSVANLILRLRQHRQRMGMGQMAYEQARSICCHKYEDECKTAALGIVEAVKHAGKALMDWNKVGRPVVTQEVLEERTAACLSCPHFQGWKALGIGYCKLCKCGTGVISLKLKMATEQCPDNPPRWKTVANSVIP